MFLNLTFAARASILGITPAVGRQKATSLPTVSSDRESHFSTTGCTQRSGSVATAGQLEPVDVKLSANTSCSRAQAPLHCLNVLSSSSAWLGKNVDLSCYSERNALFDFWVPRDLKAPTRRETQPGLPWWLHSLRLKITQYCCILLLFWEISLFKHFEPNSKCDVCVKHVSPLPKS